MMEDAVLVVEENNNNNNNEGEALPPQQLPPPLLLPPPQYYYNHNNNNNNNINNNNNNNSSNSGGSSSKSIKKAAVAAGLALAALCQWRIVVKAFGYATVCMLGHGHGVWSVLGLLLLYHDHERAADEDDDGEKKEATSSSRPTRRRMMMAEVVAGTMAGLRFTGGRFCGTLAGVLAVAWGILGACDLLLPPAWIHSLRVAPLWEAMHRVCARCQQSSRQQLQSQYRDLLYGALVSLLLLGLLWADMESDHKVLSEHPRDRERFPTTTHHQPHSAALLVLSRLEPGLAILLYARSMGFVTLALLATSDSGGRYGRLLRFGGVLFAPCWTAAWTVGGLLALAVAVRAHNTNNRSSSSSSSSAGGCGEASNNNNNNTTTTTWHQNTVAQGLMRQSLLLMKNNNNNTTTTTSTTTTMKQQGQQQLFAQQPLLLLPPHQHHAFYPPPPHNSGSSSVAGVIDALDVNEAFRLAKAQYFGGSGRPDEEKNV